ncbi:MAG: hypothetical protein JWM95_2218 [Gemmatimonadetes bacterium]|nr:hypothetical protein [Gemmatimonadota bacterium]
MGLAGAALSMPRWPGESAPTVAIVIDPDDAIASSAPVKWAVAELVQRLVDVQVTVRTVGRITDAGAGDVCIIATGNRTPLATLTASSVPSDAESLALFETRVNGRHAIVAAGADSRGLAYALLDIADRVRSPATARASLASLRITKPIIERPANPVRSVMRQFTSEPLDKPWFHDRDGWKAYLTMLATHRFNRLHLAFGLGYDTLTNVRDSYFVFTYPFLVAVPGYGVRASNLPDAERDRNLEMLRFISDETVARGLDFELGLWMHGYQMPKSPDAKYVIQGLDSDTHAPYCRDALAAVLKACPSISSVGLRIHGESGIAEGSYEFWSTIFDGVPRAGRTIEIDLHAKGIDATMIARAAKTGMPINLSPKFAAEHCGMPYHQAAIRELEMPVAGRTGAGLMTLSEGSRVFTRYGYADLMRNDRTYTVRTRIFAGTQRLLASGDPVWAAAYSRSFGFAGMTGADLMEPLTCRGRRGTGVLRRDGYRDETLAPSHDWEKFGSWYRTLGRMMYNPATAADVFRREFHAGTGGSALASALAKASRILPIVTTAHLPSAACDAYWPEIYWNQPMLAEAPGNPYTDSPSPKNFQHVSPLDPQLFSSISECADELLSGKRTGKYSPLDVERWITGLALGAERDLERAGPQTSAQARRIVADVHIQAGLGRFFGAKLMSGVFYALHEKTGDTRALGEALRAYRSARESWTAVVQWSTSVYQNDLSVSDKISEHGHWADRLGLLDQDIDQMSKKLAALPVVDHNIGAVIDAVRAETRSVIACTHTPPASFKRGVDVAIGVKTAANAVRMYYRHVNQAERYEVAELVLQNGMFRGVIPGAYTASPYGLQYYFELTEHQKRPALYPGFAAELANQPYFVLYTL